MKNISLAILFTLIISACNTNSKQLKNQKLSESEHLLMATAWFQKSAEMRACFYQAFNLAELRLAQHLKNYTGDKPPAVILDIDETILDNSPFEKFLIDNGQLYTSDLWKTWTDKASAKALPGAINFTNKAIQMGVQVIYISNRKVNMLETTLANMAALGFPNAETQFIHLREMDKSGDKTDRRTRVMEKYEVLLYIGDNLTDFSEMYAQRDSTLGFSLVDNNNSDFGNKFIILPNPMYGEWEGALYQNNYSYTIEEKRALIKGVLEGY